MTKTALLVLGMHRSGTSAFTRVLNLLGADLATNLLPPRPDNPRGFWESPELTRIHDEILASGHTIWDQWTRFDPTWYDSPLFPEHRALLLAHLGQEFGASVLFAVKDPRMCRLVRLWRETLVAFGAEAKAIIPIRHPLEVARSLKSRHGFPIAKSYLLWLRHVLDAIQDSEGMPRVIVPYDDLLGDWRTTVATITGRLHVAWPRQPSAVETEIDSFLSRADRHHLVDAQAWLEQPDLVEWVRHAYELVLTMTTEEACRSGASELVALTAQLDTATRAFAPLLRDELAALAEQVAAEREEAMREEAMRTLQARLDASGRALAAAEARASAAEAQAGALESQLKAMRDLFQDVITSASWRLTAPLRMGSRIWGRMREPTTGDGGSR